MDSKRLNKHQDTNDFDTKNIADFETALSAAGFGKFNLILLLVSVPATAASLFETTTMSYMFPVAQCDLELTLEDKGILNGITYIGMFVSGFLWGFIADTLGRRKLLMVGYFLDTAIVLCSAFSQTFTGLVIFKFLGGLIMIGPYTTLTTYVSEFHSTKYRAIVIIALGLINAVASVLVPLLSWAVLPMEREIFLFTGYKLHSWNIYLIFCSLPSLLGFIGICFMPESPKFLMSVGNNENALKVFKRIYTLNGYGSQDLYPIKSLVDETEKKGVPKYGGVITANRTNTQAIKEGLQQIKPLLFSPHRCNVILVCLIEGGIISGLQTLRLWLPQIFAAVDNYEAIHNSSASLCEMLEMVQPTASTPDGEILCEVDITQTKAYINSIIVASVSIVAYLAAGAAINILGKKVLIVMTCFTSAICTSCLYFANNEAVLVAMSSFFIASSNVCFYTMMAAMIDIFPTTLRTIAVSIVMMVGRIGSISGNILFPVLLEISCAFPFITIAVLFLICGLLAILLPKTDLKAME